MLVAALVAASMDPLVTSIAYLRGLPALPPLTALLHYLPNYICAFVAMVPSHLFQRLGRRLREAQELGSYQLVELLGQGGMGEVWRAQHRLLARDAAIKLVRPEVLGAGTRRRRPTHAPPVRARGAGDRSAELAAHDPRVRLRHDRTTAPSTT